MRQRAAETIELPYRQDIAVACEAERRRQPGPLGFCSRRRVFENARATHVGEGVELQRQILIGRRTPSRSRWPPFCVPLSVNPAENLYVRKPVVKHIDGRSKVWPANDRMTVTGGEGHHEE